MENEMEEKDVARIRTGEAALGSSIHADTATSGVPTLHPTEAWIAALAAEWAVQDPDLDDWVRFGREVLSREYTHQRGESSTWPSIWCSICCAVTPLLMDEMRRKETGGLLTVDLCCKQCWTVLATVHTQSKPEMSAPIHSTDDYVAALASAGTEHATGDNTSASCLALRAELSDALAQITRWQNDLKAWHLCHLHQPTTWESDGECPICEGHLLTSALQTLTEKREQESANCQKWFGRNVEANLRADRWQARAEDLSAQVATLKADRDGLIELHTDTLEALSKSETDVITHEVELAALKAERLTLAQAITPDHGTAWGVKELVALATAHRGDSEAVDEREDYGEIRTLKAHVSELTAALQTIRKAPCEADLNRIAYTPEEGGRIISVFSDGTWLEETQGGRRMHASFPDAPEYLQQAHQLIRQWRESAAFTHKHQGFNDAHGNTRPSDHADAMTECADALQNVLPPLPDLGEKKT